MLLEAPRMANLILSYTDPLNLRLRREIADQGLAGMALILTGEREIPAELADWHELTRWIERINGLHPERELAELAAEGIRFIVPGDDEWPQQLDDLEFPPFGLFVKGHGDFPDVEKMIALVGSRDATAYGLSVASEFGFQIATMGYTVVSGGAYGIDSGAHRGALSSGTVRDEPYTIAVLANGLDRLYPAGNSDLLKAVSERGLLVSEVPRGAAPTRSSFLNRNRIIAALCTSTTVIEARYRAGSLNTARHAENLGRRLGAVPGSIYSANSAGTHLLLRENNAQIVSTASEVIDLEYIHVQR